MAPKKGTARVVKPKDKPRKAASANVAAAAREAAKADNDLHLMWLCLKNNGGSQVSFTLTSISKILHIDLDDTRHPLCISLMKFMRWLSSDAVPLPI